MQPETNNIVFSTPSAEMSY